MQQTQKIFNKTDILSKSNIAKIHKSLNYKHLQQQRLEDKWNIFSVN